MRVVRQPGVDRRPVGVVQVIALEIRVPTTKSATIQAFPSRSALARLSMFHPMLFFLSGLFGGGQERT
jgi:hypothetical protein